MARVVAADFLSRGAPKPKFASGLSLALPRYATGVLKCHVDSVVVRATFGAWARARVTSSFPSRRYFDACPIHQSGAFVLS
jgi:hypothetical protein